MRAPQTDSAKGAAFLKSLRGLPAGSPFIRVWHQKVLAFIATAWPNTDPYGTSLDDQPGAMTVSDCLEALIAISKGHP